MTTQGWTRPRNVFFYRIGISKKILYMKSNVENDKCEFHRQHFVNGKIGVFFFSFASRNSWFIFTLVSEIVAVYIGNNAND